MAQEILQIKITADNKEALQKMRDTVAGLNGVTVAAGKSGAAMTKSATNYQNFGRVLQDLPYGFNGVANNLTQLVPSVGMLGLAFSGLVSAITFAQVGTGAWTRGLVSSKKSVEDLEKAMDGFRESAAKEIVQFKELTSVAANANIPMVQRKQAVDQLQKEYPAYLGNMSQEDILAGKIGNAYDEITKALKAKIALQALEEKVIPIIKEQLKVQEDLLNAQKAVQAVAGLTAKDFAEADKFASSTGRINPLKGLQAEAVAASQKIPELQRAYKSFETQIQGMFNSMQPFIQASASLNQEHEKEKKNLFDIIKYRQKMAGMWQESLFAAPEVQEPKATPQKMEAGLPTSAAQIDDMITKARLANMEKIRKQQEDDADYANRAILQQADLYMGVLSPAIDTMFNSLANGESVLDSLGNMFEQLTKQIAASLIKAAALAAILSLIPGGAAAAGAAAGGGFGDIFKALLGRGFASGGTATGPQSGYPVLLHGTEHIVRPDQMKSIISQSVQGALGSVQGMGQSMTMQGNGSVILRGQDLVLALQRAGVNLDVRRG